jgi:hypothetical protein
MKLAILSESTKLGLLLHNEATLHQINANPNFGLNRKQQKTIKINSINTWHENGILLCKALA